jgi:hypothetical protein
MFHLAPQIPENKLCQATLFGFVREVYSESLYLDKITLILISTSMTTKRLALFLLTTGMLMLGAASCDVLDPYEPGTSGSSGERRTGDDVVRPDERKISLNGHVRKLTLNGSVTWGFESDERVRYEIIDLAAAYQRDGLRVHVEAIVTTYPSQGYGKRISITAIDLIYAPSEAVAPPSGVLLN